MRPWRLASPWVAFSFHLMLENKHEMNRRVEGDFEDFKFNSKVT